MLGAARTASALVDTFDTPAVDAPAEQVPDTVSEPPTVVVTAPKLITKPKPVKTVKPASTAKQQGGMANYAALAETYYAELRCRNMSRAGVNALYARILQAHRMAVANHGTSAVRQMLRRAERRAATGSCG